MGQFAKVAYDYVVPTDKYGPVSEVVNELSKSVSEPEEAELVKDNDAYYVAIHQSEPANEAGHFQRVEVTMTVTVYYGLQLRNRWNSDGPVARLWLPDTWDPQLFVEAVDSKIWVSKAFAYLSYYFPINATIAKGARVWTEMWLPVDITKFPAKGGVGLATISINLVQRDVIAGKSLPEGNSSLAGSSEWVVVPSTTSSGVP